ncbi:MAG: DUF4215 domain-containing protein [Myxococcales bacterium]|nr:DUF4215 domain-containing protein [Myxococcales bacterium]
MHFSSSAAPLCCTLLAACFNPGAGGPDSAAATSTTTTETTSSPSTSSPAHTSDTTASDTSTTRPDPTTTAGDPSSTTTTAVTGDETTTTTTSDASTTGDPPAKCGDGQIDGDEQCDDGNAASGDGCSVGCFREYRMFVTRDLTLEPTLGQLDGGLQEADELCTSAADAAGLSGMYRAFLSGERESAKARLKHDHDGPLIRTDGEPLAADLAALYSTGHPDRPVDVDEYGATVLGTADCLPATNLVWTGTSVLGEPVAGLTCDSWTAVDAVDEGSTGFFKAPDAGWTAAGCKLDCGAAARLYCVEVDV